ncbi:MAG: peptidylprolyl isomerase [Campylobacterota bacterium]|nr:peptidylprolyl isomerase [Campylobacterota bacterium]
MIIWMQKHKKWLIVTIWISTIAFVGAGFVGWGSYQYGKSSSVVATVGETEIPLSGLQNEYSSLYSQYQRMFGTSFNKELAEQLKLEDAAFQRITQKYLLLNYAQELGLIVTDNELAKELLKIESFYKDGKFDKATYMSVLKLNRRTALEFEEQLKQDLLVQKVQKIFNSPLEKNEISNISNLVYMEDKVSLSIINKSDIKVDYKDSELKEFWNKNKENYKSEKKYKVNYFKVDNDTTKTQKEMKRVALKEYVKLKKGTLEFNKDIIISKNNSFFNIENFNKIIENNINTVIKPFYNEDNYYIVKIEKEIEPSILAYDDVKEQILLQFIATKKDALANEKAQKVLNNFSGKDIGYINSNSNIEIDGLNSNESSEVIKSILKSNIKSDLINLNNKVVVFLIEDSRLGKYNSDNNQEIIDSIGSIKENLLMGSLLEELKNKYEIKSFIGKK